MAQPKGSKVAVSSAPKPITPETKVPEATTPEATAPETAIEATPTGTPDEQAIEETFTALKTLLSTVEKLQKARQNVGDIKSLLSRLLDGEMLSGEELEHVKVGVSGLGKLVKLYGDYQGALAKAQPARQLLDEMLKP